MRALEGPISKASGSRSAEHGDVGDAAEVERAARRGGGGAQQQHIEQAGQWCAVAPGGDVPVADVTYHGGARPLGDPGRLAQLQRAPGGGALDPVVDGLAVRAYGVHAPVRVRQVLGHVAEKLADGHVEAADLFDRGRRRGQYGRDVVAHRPRVGDGAVLDQVAHEAVPIELEVGQQGLDGVERRARDHADDAHK